MIIYSPIKMKYSKLFGPIRAASFFVLFPFFFGNVSCGTQDGKEVKRITNSPPVISSINLLPEKPTRESEIDAFVQGHDPDGDVVTYQYQWLRNDEEIIGETKSSLKSGILRKGDFIRVRATPSDGKTNGTAFLSAPLKILNSSPMIQEVWIEPKVAYATDRLKVNVRGSDPDGDSIYYSYEWKKNGVLLSEKGEEFLERGQFKKGDSIMLTAFPADGEIQGPPKKSETLVISNSPPLIVSSPPTSIEGAKYVYQVQAEDLDNDPLTFTLKSGPKGMEIDKDIGLIQWRIQREDKGKHIVEIEVSDDAGAKSLQRYTLAVDFR
jgi:hypothetical protein